MDSLFAWAILLTFLFVFGSIGHFLSKICLGQFKSRKLLYFSNAAFFVFILLSAFYLAELARPDGPGRFGKHFSEVVFAAVCAVVVSLLSSWIRSRQEFPRD